LLTVSIGNIDVAEEHLVDDITPFEDTTVKDALNKLLEASGAILYVKDDTVYVKPRAATTTDPVTFYGQASNIGIENLIDATSIRSGRNKMFTIGHGQIQP
jgi:CBS domain-containing protein